MGNNHGQQLRHLRVSRGLTQQEVADLLRAMARSPRSDSSKSGPELGVDAQMVSKWERGAKRPSPMYRALLCELFDIEYLDLWFADEKDELTKRRDFLAVSAATTLTAVDFVAESKQRIFQARASVLPTEFVDSIELTISSIEQNYEYQRPEEFLATVIAQERLVSDLYQKAGTGDRTRLFVAAGYLASLHANIAFNINDIRTAVQLGKEALELGELSGSEELREWSLVNLSMFALYSGSPHEASELSELTRRSTAPQIAYLLNFKARALADLGDRKEAERAVSRSYEVMDALRAEQQGEPGFSMHTFNRADLDCETATVYAKLGDAARCLRYAKEATEIVDQTNKSGLRAQVRFPMAEAQLTLGNVDEAHALVRDAYEIAGQRRPWWFFARMTEFQGHLSNSDSNRNRELLRRILNDR